MERERVLFRAYCAALRGWIPRDRIYILIDGFKAMEIVLSPTIDTDPADLPPADPSPSLSKVWQDASGDFVIADSEGIRLGVRWRFDNNGYDVSSSMFLPSVLDQHN